MEKFEDMVVFARTLPRLRKRVDAELADGDELTYDRVCACAVRLLDRGFFRVGGEDYAVRNESYGLATMKKSHVSMRDGVLRLRLPGQVGQAPRAGGGRPGGGRGRARPQAPPRRRRRAAGLQARPALGRPALGGHQRLAEAGHRQGRLGQGLPHLGGDRARGRRARRLRGGGRDARPGASARSRAPSRRSPTTWATRRPSRGPPTSTRASSTATATARPSTTGSWARPARPATATRPRSRARSRRPC